MKIDHQTRPDLAHVAELIEAIPVAMLTNVDAEGELASRPMYALTMDRDGAIWFFADLRSAKVENLRTVNLGFSDAAHGTYVSLTGHGEIDVDRAHIERLWTPLARPWFRDGPDSKDLCLLKFVPAAAAFWDAPSSRMVRAFGLLASMVSDTPVALGEHGVFTNLDARPPVAGAPDVAHEAR